MLTYMCCLPFIDCVSAVPDFGRHLCLPDTPSSCKFGLAAWPRAAAQLLPSQLETCLPLPLGGLAHACNSTGWHEQGGGNHVRN